MYRIYHDFNKVCAGPDDLRFRSAPLICSGTKRDLEVLGLTLADGMEVMLYMPDAQVAPDGSPDDLEVRGVIRYDDREKCFVADYILADLMYRTEAESKKK